MIITLQLEKRENSLLFERSTQPGYTENFLYQNGLHRMLWMGHIVKESEDTLILESCIAGYDKVLEAKKAQYSPGEAFLSSGKFVTMVNILQIDFDTQWSVEYRWELKSFYKKWFQNNSSKFLTEKTIK